MIPKPHRPERGDAEGRPLPAWRSRVARAAAAALAIFLIPVMSPPRSLGADNLFPFVLPWDDESQGPTNLSGWNRPIETEADRLHVVDGHLYRGAERIRLWGFDLGSGSALSDPAVDDRIAARLARMGVNYVRIAQNSNPVPSGWLDPATGTLDPEVLSRLDDFLEALRRHGIYVHLVLNHFRTLYPPGALGFDTRRGLPEGWPEYGTGITAFYTPVIEANKVLARGLLTHRNPRTGLTYADDPAIAIVEVTNEDGLVQSWDWGALDPLITGTAPALRRIEGELQTRWNRWLRARHGDDDSLRAAWAEGASPAGGELLTNGGFERGQTGWRLELHGAASAGIEASGHGPQPGTRSLDVGVVRADAEGWHVTLSQNRLHLEEGRPYRLALWARASSPAARMTVSLQQANPPYRVITAAVEWTLTDEWREYTTELAANAAEADAKLNLVVGYQPQTISVARVSLRQDAVTGLSQDESAAAGTVRPLARATLALHTPAAQRDWVAFLFDTQREFFAGQFRFLRDELRVRSLLVGSQADYNPSDAQTGSDVTSMHGYWSHPAFPGRSWDPDNWFVRNLSMTGARDQWYSLNHIAFYRRAGMPLVVDEYNHPQPNTFGAEGFVLAAAYGSFQDWDGLAGWAYREGWGSHWLSQEDWARPVIRGYFSLDTDPVRLLSSWVGGVLFRRGDVDPGSQPVTVGLAPDAEREVARTTGLNRRHEVAGRDAELLPILHRVAVQAGAPPAPAQSRPQDGLAVSDTGQLVWDVPEAGRGIVTVNSPRTKAVIGFGGGRVFPLGPVTLRPGPTAQRGFGVWVITAMDGAAPLDTARHMIIVALGYSQNTDPGWMIYPDHPVGDGPPPEGASITLRRQWGTPPVVAEGVPARITLPATTDRVRVWALDERGQRTEPVPVEIDEGHPTVEIGPQYRTLWYEVSVETP